MTSFTLRFGPPDYVRMFEWAEMTVSGGWQWVRYGM